MAKLGLEPRCLRVEVFGMDEMGEKLLLRGRKKQFVQPSTKIHM
jgi:hypothetical protein